MLSTSQSCPNWSFDVPHRIMPRGHLKHHHRFHAHYLASHVIQRIKAYSLWRAYRRPIPTFAGLEIIHFKASAHCGPRYKFSIPQLDGSEYAVSSHYIKYTRHHINAIQDIFSSDIWVLLHHGLRDHLVMFLLLPCAQTNEYRRSRRNNRPSVIIFFIIRIIQEASI